LLKLSFAGWGTWGASVNLENCADSTHVGQVVSNLSDIEIYHGVSGWEFYGAGDSILAKKKKFAFKVQKLYWLDRTT
jgi:hypothetical protein